MFGFQLKDRKNKFESKLTIEFLLDNNSNGTFATENQHAHICLFTYSVDCPFTYSVD